MRKLKQLRRTPISQVLDMYQEELCASLPTEEELVWLTFSDRFETRMEKLLRHQRRFYYRWTNTVGKKIACLIAAILLLAATVTMSIGALREPFIRFIVESFEQFTDLFFTDTSDEPVIEITPVVPKYVPDGFDLINRVDGLSGVYCVYQNENKQIIYSQYVMDIAHIRVDTENADYQNIMLHNGQQAYISENKNESTLTFASNDFVFMFTSSIGKSEFIKMAESIEI